MLGSGSKYVATSMSEMNPIKQKFIFTIMHPGGKTCCFKQVGGMAGRVADCATHGGQCIVRVGTVVIGGFTCKDMSNMNPHKKSGHTKSCLRDGTGKSGTAFHEMLSVLDGHEEIVWFFGENVDELLDAFSDNRVALIEAPNLG